MSKKTTEQAAYIAELERKLKEAQAAQIHRLYYAGQNISKASVDNLLGSAVIIEISFLGGKTVIDPVMIPNGLSNETIAALKADFKRAWDYKTELKP